MTFRWSAGDIVKCVELIVRVSKGLKDSTGASAEYEAAVDFLNGLKTTLDKLNEHLEAYPDTFHGKDLAEQAERLKTAVEKFKAKAEKFEASLAPGSTKSSFRRAPKKIQWTLFADSIKELQAAILQPQNVLNTILLLQALKAAEQASQTSALSQQELAKIGISVFNILPAQLAGLANDLKEVLDEHLSPAAEHQQREKLERREEIQKLRESIEQQSQKYTSLEISLQIQQRLVLDTLESSIQAHLDALFEGLQLKDASANVSAEVDGASPQNEKAEGDTGQGMLLGMAAGLHMLGYVMSGVLNPMLRSLENEWATSRIESGYHDSASIDSRFLAIFDCISSSLESGARVELPATIPTETWTKEYKERTKPYCIMPMLTPLKSSLETRPRPTPQPTRLDDPPSHRRLNEIRAVPKNWPKLYGLDSPIDPASLRHRVFSTCSFIFSVGDRFPYPHAASSGGDDLPSLRHQDQQPIESTSHLYRWSGGQISCFTGVTTSKYLHSSITLVRMSYGRYFATPGDATPESNWNRPTFSYSMSVHRFMFLDYARGVYEDLRLLGVSVPNISELQKWAQVSRSTPWCISGRVELMLAYIASTFDDVDEGLIAQQPWKLTWWEQSRAIRAAATRQRGIFVQVWLDPDNPDFSTAEALSVFETCPVFLSEKDHDEDIFNLR